MLEEIKNNKEELSKSLSLNIDSIFVEEKGKLEKIFYKSEELHELRSCSKILVTMALGIVLDKKMLVNGQELALYTKIYPLIKHVANITNKSNLEKIEKWTIRNLLTHTTGYESQMFSEKYLEKIDENKVLDYALNFEVSYEPGERYAYNNLEPFLISVIFTECLNINLSDFINKYIFQKLDIKEYKWKNFGKYCSAGTGLQLKHSDFHKIGQLLLNDGKYNGKQIVPDNWIKEMCKLQIETPNQYNPERVLPKIGVGYFTFISRDDYIFRDGTNGQYIILNKNKELLITIMSSESKMKNITEILRNII